MKGRRPDARAFGCRPRSTGETVQDARTDQMIHPVEATMSLISYTRPPRRADPPAEVGYALIGQGRAVTTCPPSSQGAGPTHAVTLRHPKLTPPNRRCRDRAFRQVGRETIPRATAVVSANNRRYRLEASDGRLPGRPSFCGRTAAARPPHASSALVGGTSRAMRSVTVVGVDRTPNIRSTTRSRGSVGERMLGG